MVVLDAAPRPTPLSPVPESSTGSQSIHGLGAARSYRQLPPVLEGDVTVPSHRTPESSPSAASLSANDTYRLAVEAWPSDSEASATESTVTTASVAESAQAAAVSKNGARRMTEPSVQPAKKSPRSSVLGKPQPQSKKLSRASPGAASSGEFKNLRVDGLEEPHSSVKQRATRRAASEPPRSLGGEVRKSGSPPPRQSQVSLATPPRTKRASIGERPGIFVNSNDASTSAGSKGKLQKSPQPSTAEAQAKEGELARRIATMTCGPEIEASRESSLRNATQKPANDGFRRSNELLDSKLITAEAGEFERIHFPEGFITELVCARYGTLDTDFKDWADVTDQTREDLLQGRAVPVTNERMGLDPKIGCRKVFRIQYKHSTNLVEVVVQEGQGLELPPGSAEGLVCAFYGISDKVVDVIAPLRQLMLSGQQVTVSNEEFGVDPAPGQVKQLRVQYQSTPRSSFRLYTGGELASFEVLAAPLFASLLQVHSVSYADFLQSLVSGNLLGGKTEASGKSGEIFWRTRDHRYVLKTVSEQEVGQLIKMLPEYKEHLEGNPDSVLTRYYGAYRFHLNGENTFFVVMSNVLAGLGEIQALFDLKGTTEDRWVDPKTGGCLKDNNFAPITLFLDRQDAKMINDCLAADTAFLQEQGIMDYSLLVALCPPDDPVPVAETAGHHRVFSAKESRGLWGETRDCTVCLGLVDMLVTYGWKKKVAHLLKALTIGWVDEIDTMPPHIYAERFCNYFAKKIRPQASLLQVTSVPSNLFKTPCGALGRSGGTASFFATELLQQDGAQGEESKHYWLGKDLARARDEVVFYEVAKTLQGKDGWQILNFMTPYRGVCRAPCAVKDGKDAEDVDLELRTKKSPAKPLERTMLLRNCRDGMVSARMLDIKMGNVTAVGGWQGKGNMKAFVQNITVDSNTNSAGEGFRLEGFDNPPALLRSIEHLQLSHIPRHAQKRLRRFNLQRMQAVGLLIVTIQAPEYTRDFPDQAPGPPNERCLRAIEVQEQVLLQCIQQVAGLVVACRKVLSALSRELDTGTLSDAHWEVPVPQQWIGSSVMFVFDCATFPQRASQSVPTRVHIFDWGRSELNTEEGHARLSQSEQADRQKFWRLYRIALAKLLYQCCSLYVARFWKPVASIAFRVWDKDAFTDDDFIGAAELSSVLAADEATGTKDLQLQDMGGHRVKAGFLFKGETSVKVSFKPLNLPSTSRLCGGDVASPSDPFVEISALGAPASFVRKNLGHGKLEKFRSARGAARHLATALGDDAKDAFRRALLQGTHHPRCAKLGFVGPARAGKTSTLQALAGLPLRRDQESTHGLACWALSQDLISAAPGQRWQLQDAQTAASSSRWDRGVAKHFGTGDILYVADLVRPPGNAVPPNAAKMGKQESLDEKAVMKRMPVDLIARRLGETAANLNTSHEDKTVVLEAYDFGGQEVYYAMHHLFLSDYGIYLACIDLSAFNAMGVEEAKESEASDTWQALEWWLASIAVHAPNSPVAIVGTHDDCLSQDSRRTVYAEVNERISAFCTKLPELNEQLQINEQSQLCFFPVDNATTDSGRSICDLREAIESMVAKLLQGPLSTAVPLRWSHFWAVLQRTGGSGNLGPLTRVEDLWQRCKRYGFESRAELQNFLRHFHGLGALLHFPESVFEELRDLICLKPGWVGDAAAAVLTAKDKVFQGCVNQVAELKEKGLLHAQLLATVWRAKHFAKYQGELVGLLQALDLLLSWGHDKQSPLQRQNVFLVPSQLPLRPLREREGDDQDACVLYLDFHGLLRRLLPTLIPRLLCSLSKVESGVQILSMYANFATFAVSTQGQAQGDSLRYSGHWRPRELLLVSVQPWGDLLRCSLRPRRSEAQARHSWRHVERLLHNFREAITAWMPRISFRAGIRCPSCTAGHTHVLDLHSVLRDEDLAVCPKSGDIIEDLPSWLLDWRQHLLQRQQPGSGSPRGVGKPEESDKRIDRDPIKPGEMGPVPPKAAGLQLDYLYASPLDVAPLDIRSEIEALATMPGVECLSVRTATTETLAEVWRTERSSPAPRVLVLSAHCAVEKSQPSLLLEDAVGHAQVVGIRDMDELLALNDLNGPDLAAGDRPSGLVAEECRVFFLACDGGSQA
ncbi:Pip5kl1 [Symbiodinium necroappetens]|uniref:non-specific serine/threonine protein kinase n=1 Tax=Symbiodinium necroappetens TaxID=1628268 RepID=A0A812XZS4_9DINO|nr:Pip5kl1 [Symbiodinium necroappetens]